MANFVYTPAKTLIAKGDLDFDTQDLWVALLMTNTTADTEQDEDTMSGFGTLDEYNGAGYVRKAIANVVAEDLPNNRAEIGMAAAITWAALGAGTRQCQGMVVYKDADDDGDPADDALNKPIAWIDTGGFPFTGNGGDVTVTWNAEGILQIT